MTLKRSLSSSWPAVTPREPPSQADQLLTTQLRRTLAGLEIAILDHLIVAGSRAISAGGV
ncbi:MAG: hypothetical protein EBT58_04035 [Betaproteobacteria bacterium]|nr:hypothetical protein [Betaproteobacteria bacterium]